MAGIDTNGAIRYYSMKGSSSDNDLLRKCTSPTREGKITSSNRTYNYLERSPDTIVMDAARKQLERRDDAAFKAGSMLRRQTNTTMGSTEQQLYSIRHNVAPCSPEPDRVFKRFEYLLAKLTAEVSEQPAMGILERLKEQFRMKKSQHLAAHRPHY